MTLVGRALIGDTSCHGEIEDGRFHLLVGDVLSEPCRNGQSFLLNDVDLGPPFEDVRFVNVMGGFNAPGTSRPPDRVPWWLPKATRYPSGDHCEVQYPASLTGALNMEAELAVVVRKTLRAASPEEAHDSIFGWTVFNDWTAAEFGDFAFVGLWATGKSMDGFTSWGPWIRRDLTEERVMEGLAIRGYVNGQEAQSGTTRDYAFTPSEMLSHVSHRISLFPGDVVALGTPYPAAPVQVGDEIVCEVEEVGVLTNYVVADKGEPPTLQPRRVRRVVSSPGGAGELEGREEQRS